MSAAEKLPDLLTEDEAAAKLKVSKITLSRYRKSGLIGHIPIGRKIFYTDSIISQYLERQECRAFASPMNIHSSSALAQTSGISNGAPGERSNAALRALRILDRPE